MDTSYLIQRAGGVPALARLLLVSPQAIRQWGPTVPPLRAYQIKEMKPRWYAEWRRQSVAA
jgi:hypothetical protein